MGYKKGERDIYRQTVKRGSRSRRKKKEKKRRRGGRRREKEGEKADALLLLRTCHISGMRRGNSGSRRDRGRDRDGRSSHNSKTFSNISWPLLRHFSSDLGSERAGWWRGQPLSDVHSQPQSEDV